METQPLCRICLTMSDSDHFYNIYAAQSSDQKSIYEVINYVYDLEVFIDDGFPEGVCWECLDKVRGFELYKRSAHRAKLELISLWEKNNVKPEKKMVTCKDAGTPSWLQDTNNDNINYVEYHESEMVNCPGEEETKEGPFEDLQGHYCKNLPLYDFRTR